MNQSSIEPLFLCACAENGLSPAIEKTWLQALDWQIDFVIQNRRFSICHDGRDGFVFLERIGTKYISFDQGDSEPILVSDKEACTRAAIMLLTALKDPNFHGFKRKVI